MYNQYYKLDCYGRPIVLRKPVRIEHIKPLSIGISRMAVDDIDNRRWLIHDTETWFPGDRSVDENGVETFRFTIRMGC